MQLLANRNRAEQKMAAARPKTLRQPFLGGSPYVSWGMSVIYVKRSCPEREIRAKNDYLFGEPGNGCALFAAGFCMYEI